MNQTHQGSLADDSSEPTAAPSDHNLRQAHREILRLNQLLLEQGSQLEKMETSASWRFTRPLRLITQLRPHIKQLVIFALIALLTLPIWPLILAAMLFKSGRHFIWNLLLRYPKMLDFLVLIKAHLPGAPAQAEGLGSQTQIYRRSSHSRDISSDEERRWLVLQLLSPQKRQSLGDIDGSQSSPLSESENPETTSLSTTEASLLKVMGRSDTPIRQP